ncbi:MAG: ribosome silencing factor [Pseudomonadota bacterium]
MADNPPLDHEPAHPAHDDVMAAIQDVLSQFDARDILHIPLEGMVTYADSVLIATGASSRHIVAMAQKIVEDLKAIGLRVPSPEGMNVGDWVLIDASDVVVHLFRGEVREYYRIEDIWLDHAPKRAQQ